MLTGRKIRIKPTPEQELLFKKSAGTARWAYNFFLAENERVSDEYLENDKTDKKFISEGEVRKYINNSLKPTTHSWLSEVGSNVMKQAVKDANDALQEYLKGDKGKPRFKSKRNTKPSFYVNYESLVRKNGGFRGERLGFVRTSEPLPELPEGQHYLNPRISFDGKFWYLSFSYEIPDIQYELTVVSLGIDLGIKDLAICSDQKVYANINKSETVRKLKKQLRREQRKLSRKIESNIVGYKVIKGHRHPIYTRPLEECANIQKQKHKVAMIYRRLNGIRNNYLHQTTAEIVKTKPSRIVMEDLNIQGMMKNKHLSDAIQEQKLYEFKRQISYKCAKYGIELIEVPRFYPSSKTCSCCGNIKPDLKLSDRTYVCSECGLVIDRDYNASLNLANYSCA